MRRLAAAFTGAILLAGPAWAESPGADLLATLDQLMFARAVSDRCGHPDSRTADSFQHRYAAALDRAEAAMKALSSDLTVPHIKKLMNDHYGEIDRRSSVMITQESCNGPHIQQALQKYDGVANSADTQPAIDGDNQ